jgi:hypothetical protein
MFLWGIAPCSPVSEPTLRRNLMSPLSGSKLSMKPTCNKGITCFMLVSCWAYSATLSITAKFSSETSAVSPGYKTDPLHYMV